VSIQMFYLPNLVMDNFTQSRLFVLVNHGRSKALEPFHGRAVRLYAGNVRTPFHGAFIDQEMRVKGRYPHSPDFADRPIQLPVQWQQWIDDAPGGGGGGGDGGDEDEDEMDEDKDKSDAEVDDMASAIVLKPPGRSGQQGYHDTDTYTFQSNAHTSLSPKPQLLTHHQESLLAIAGPDTSTAPKSITFVNPMTNPSELKAIIDSAQQQPNWKAAVVEGESWEGTAEENIAKYKRVLPPPDAA
jgi:hypothetical protein